MKSLLKFCYAVFALGMIGGFASCGSDDDVIPEGQKPMNRIYNYYDSLSLCDVFKAVDGWYWGTESAAKFKSCANWENVTWEYIPEKKKFFAVGLTLKQTDVNHLATLPSAIGNLAYLRTLTIEGAAYTGSVPSQIANLQNLVELTIKDTNFESFPSNLVSSRMTAVTVAGNELDTICPSSVCNLYSDPANPGATKFDFSGNGFKNKVPAIFNANVDLSGNAFTEMNWDVAGGTKHENGYTLVMLNDNKFSGEIPAEVLDELKGDATKLANFKKQVRNSDGTYPFSNMPN